MRAFFFLLSTFVFAGDVIPVVFDISLNIQGEYVSVFYYTSPQAEAEFVEPAEQVWHIQDKSMLLLGATGENLPLQILERKKAWIRIGSESSELLEIFPFKERIDLSDEGQGLAKALSFKLGGQHSGFIAQVANYVAGNAAILSIDASAYLVGGVAVIDSTGAWVGSPFAGITDLELRLDALEAKTSMMHVSNNRVYFSGVNLHINNGEGTTNSKNGTGNLIIGYDEHRDFESNKTGSHNIVRGTENNYSSYGGIIGGISNDLSAPYAAVLGGLNNQANGQYSAVVNGIFNNADSTYGVIVGGEENSTSGNLGVVLGGQNNQATGVRSIVSGGIENIASGELSAVNGGRGGQAIGMYSTINGGQENEAEGTHGTVNGGRSNQAYGLYTTVNGGYDNFASGNHATVNGGRINLATGGSSSISGGREGLATGDYASVTGGFSNLASGEFSSVSGGNDREASGQYDWVAGAAFEDQKRKTSQQKATTKKDD